MSKLYGRCGFISLLYSISDNPLGLWSKHVSTDGCVKRVKDDGLNGDKVIEITGPQDCPVPTNITCPASPEDFLNIQLPILVIVLIDINDTVQIAFQLLDEDNVRRKFFLSTREDEKTKNRESDTARITMKLSEGWNLLEIDLRDLCQTTYRTEYRALQRLIIYPNCRVRRIYLQDRHYEDNETPVELCQAFFDMYMLKWGINFVDNSCQTNDTIKHIDSDVKQSIPLNENPIYVGKSKNAKSLSVEKLSALKSSRVSTIKGLARKIKNPENNNAKHGNAKKMKSSESGMRKKIKSNDKVREKTNFCDIASSPVKLQKKSHSDSDELKINNSTNKNSKSSVVVDCLENNVPERKIIRTSLPIGSLAPVEKIPSSVETQAFEFVKNVESAKSKLLTTDEAIENFLQFRHAINEKMLKIFRVRGLTMTEVELSIYNSKHRRNSYGQGKLVEKHRVSVDKACNYVTDNSLNA